MFSRRIAKCFLHLTRQCQGREKEAGSDHGKGKGKGSTRGFKVTVVGAATGLGSPLCLLLKQNRHISQLNLHDVSGTKGMATDLSHISTPTLVRYFKGTKELGSALEDADIVVMSVGISQNKDMQRTEIISLNCGLAIIVAKAVSVSCPKALVAIISHPTNSVVPAVAEVLEQEDAFDPKRLFGVTTLDVLRAKTVVGKVLGVNPQLVSIPVVGGNEGKSIVPLFSQCKPSIEGSQDRREQMVRIIQTGSDIIIKGYAILSSAYACAHFINALLSALNGAENIIECAYVRSDVSELKFFASPVLLGPEGIEQNLGLPDLDESEEQAIETAISQLSKDIESDQKIYKRLLSFMNTPV